MHLIGNYIGILTVVWIHVSHSMLAKWSDWMLHYSDPIHTETIRMAVAKSLQICGVVALNTACLSQVEENIPHALW